MFMPVFARWPGWFDQILFVVPLLVSAGIILVRVLLARLRRAHEAGTRGRKIMIGIASIAFLAIWPVAVALVWPLGMLLFVVGLALAVYTLAWSGQADNSPALPPRASSGGVSCKGQTAVDFKARPADTDPKKPNPPMKR